MAYVSQEMKKSLAPGIKRVLKKYNMKATIAVNHHSTLMVNIKSGPLDVVGQYNKHMADFREHRGDREPWKDVDNVDVNPYHFKDTYNGTVLAFITELHAAMNRSDDGSECNFNKSDLMTDYHNVGWYVDMNIGRWNKPYILTEAATPGAAATVDSDGIQTLKCQCCGKSTRGRQWHNLDTGHGTCSACVKLLTESGEDVAQLCGEAGTHHSLTDEPTTAAKAAPSATVTAETAELKLTETQHTKSGVNIWVASLVDRVERSKYTELLTKAKSLGGYYSRYNKDGAIPGFIFKTPEAAQSFLTA